MAIIRAKRDRNFTVIDNCVFADKQLSFAAIGLLCYLLSKPDNWAVSAQHLTTVTEDTAKESGINAVHNLLKELREVGFLVMKKQKTGEADYFVFDVPQTKKPNQEKPNQEKPNQEKPNQEKPNQEKPNQEKPDVLINTESKQELNNNNTPLPPNLADETHDCANALVAADATTGGGDLESLADIADQPSNPASLAENDAAAHSGSPKRKANPTVPTQQVLQTYNDVLGNRLPKAQMLNDKRKRVIAQRWREMLNSQDPSGKVRFTDTASGLAWFAKFFAKVAMNPHWLGENDRGWRADLDWILKPDNFLRILEWRPK